MGKNVSPTKGQPLFRIEGRPHEHDAVIERQGQFARILKAQICPCIKNGIPDIWDTKCKGKGFLFSHQKYIKVTDENSPHGIYHKSVIRPFYNPITKVNKIIANNNIAGDDFNSQGELKVVGFTDDEIYLDTNQVLPHPYQPIRNSYEYLRFDKVTETIQGTGYHKVQLQKTKIGNDLDDQYVPNFNNFWSDIVLVDSCSNGFVIESYFKQFVIFNQQQAAPTVNDSMTIEYWTARPFKIVVTSITSQMLQENEVFSGMDVGDAMLEVQGIVDIGRGDIVTLYATTERRSEILQYDGTAKQELSEFDVKNINGFIIDEDGNKYENDVDFVLTDYNFIYWIGNTPVQNKNFSISYDFYITYRVMKPLPTYIGQENKQWPKTFLAKKYIRMFPQQRENINNIETPTDQNSGSNVNIFTNLENDIGI